MPVVALVVFALGAVGVTRLLVPVVRPPTCVLSTGAGGALVLSPEQAGHAATIAAVGARRGLPERAVTVALATALQESKLRNLPEGDRDSLGLFQQRPSQGWGSAEQVQDPVYAAGRFYDALIKVSGWQALPLTEAAQRVQRSAYPLAYAAHEDEASVYAQALLGVRPRAVACRLPAVDAGRDRPVAASARAAALVAALRDETGFTGQVSDGAVTFTALSAQRAAGAAAWAVAQADRFGIASVTLGDRAWRRGTGDEALSWQDARTPSAAAASVRIELADVRA